MAEKIIMPQGGQDIMEGRVLRWHKSEGDPVQKDEVICEVETEKAVFEVKSPVDGVLLKIVVAEGKVAQVFSTIGYVGEAGESKNMTHQQKKLNEDELSAFRTRFGIPISDEEAAAAPFYRAPEESAEIKYLRQRREELGGPVPLPPARCSPQTAIRTGTVPPSRH